jgi:hypothetical protein
MAANRDRFQTVSTHSVIFSRTGLSEHTQELLMTKFLSRTLLAAGVVAFAGIAQAGPQAGPMTGSGETSMTPTTTMGAGPSMRVHGYSQQLPASSGSGETSLTPATQSMGAGPAVVSRGAISHPSSGLTGSGETSLTPTTHSLGVPSLTTR